MPISDKKIKIPKKFLFTEGDIHNYLKTCAKFGNLEQELIATLAYKKAIEKIYRKSTLISFPYKPNREKEINERSFLVAKDYGTFIKKNSNQQSPIDSILVDPQDSRTSIVHQLQIKYLGKGKYGDVTDNKFIELLKSYTNFSGSGISLVVILDGPHKLELKNVVSWLERENYPFSEVVLVYTRNFKREIEVFQLKPSDKGNFYSVILRGKEVFGIT